MVRERKPPAREPMRPWLARRSTMATSTPANANSPPNISPVGPPPAITTAWSVISPPANRYHGHVDLAQQLRAEGPQLHRESSHRFDVPAQPHTSTTTHAFRDLFSLSLRLLSTI